MELMELVRQHYDELVAIRRYCHEHPELSDQEIQTMAFIQEKLDSYGIANRHIDGGGILAWIDGAKPGKTILLRADIDALPIEENKTNLACPKACVSQTPGVMHACGHDAHIAMLLMEGKLLNGMKADWDGRVILMFEQGEELTGNVRNILRFIENESGWTIDTCYATHVRWDIPSGKVAVCEGPAMAGGFGFKIRLTGQGGHGSRPDLADSPIDCFTAFYHDLQALRMRTVSPMECLTLSIGTLHSGELLNVIPNELTFSGTSRFFSYENAGKAFYEQFLAILKNDCANYNCQYKILRMPKPLYEVQNDDTCVKLARQALTKRVGPDVLTDVHPWMASETMALTLRLYPGVLTFTGIASAAVGSGANHHTPEFDVDEEGLVYGTAAAIAYALEFLHTQPAIPFTRHIVSLEDLISRNL